MPQYPAHPFLAFAQDKDVLDGVNIAIKKFYGDGWRIEFNKKRGQQGRYQVRHTKAKYALKETVHFQEAWAWLFFAAVFETDIKTGTGRDLPFDPKRVEMEDIDEDDTDEDEDSVLVDFSRERD